VLPGIAEISNLYIHDESSLDKVIPHENKNLK
jgi:hypothetical protein